ncbi:MAG TPA: hypothetical protein VJS11_06545 [Acidobacteriaceae bacterium]|nr:hypothetical protein [Acidobacteriaceae bacterium]
MKHGWRTNALTPLLAILSALAALACCLPLALGAALGALGLGAFFTRFQVEFIILSVVFLGVGVFQMLCRGRICRRRSRVELALWLIAAVVVIAVVLFPQWIAGLLAGAHHL